MATNASKQVTKKKEDSDSRLYAVVFLAFVIITALLYSSPIHDIIIKRYEEEYKQIAIKVANGEKVDEKKYSHSIDQDNQLITVKENVLITMVSYEYSVQTKEGVFYGYAKKRILISVFLGLLITWIGFLVTLALYLVIRYLIIKLKLLYIIRKGNVINKKETKVKKEKRKMTKRGKRRRFVAIIFLIAFVVSVLWFGIYLFK
jgi:cytoskeletal protein RodZ